jgi:hypothetical protein
VTNESHEHPTAHQYTVSIDDVTEELMACTCPHHVYCNAFCKHMAAVETATDDGSLDAFPSKDDERTSGPYIGYDKYSNVDHTYWMCEDCGAEATRKDALTDCCSPCLPFPFLARQPTLSDGAQRTLTECAGAPTERDDTPTTERDLLDGAQAHAADVAAAHFPDLPVEAIEWEVSHRRQRSAGATKYDPATGEITISLAWDAFEQHGWEQFSLTVRHELIHVW